MLLVLPLLPAPADNLPTQAGCCEALIAIFLPPLAVLMRRGCGGSFLLNIILTILGWVPGVIHAWIVIIAEPSRHHSRPSRPSHGHSNHHSSSHAGHHHHHHSHSHGGGHHGGHHSHTGRHHARPARKSYDRPVYRDGYDAVPARYGGGAAPPSYGPPPQMGYAPPSRRY